MVSLFYYEVMHTLYKVVELRNNTQFYWEGDKCACKNIYSVKISNIYKGVTAKH